MQCKDYSIENTLCSVSPYERLQLGELIPTYARNLFI